MPFDRTLHANSSPLPIFLDHGLRRLILLRGSDPNMHN